jgi:hypothetical protein
MQELEKSVIINHIPPVTEGSTLYLEESSCPHGICHPVPAMTTVRQRNVEAVMIIIYIR